MHGSGVQAWVYRYLWLAPRGWVLKWRSDSHARMVDLVAGKRVAIVGNAASLLDKQQGDEIESYDLVVRLNKGFVIDPVAQGHRTDMVGLSPELTEAELIDQFSPRVFLMLIPKMRHFLLFDSENISNTLFYPYRFWTEDKRLIGRKPSSGFMAISWMRRTGAAKEIGLFGFDFGVTPTYYNPPDYSSPHDFESEGAIVQHWIKDGEVHLR